jgi:hypothetical protein
MWQCHIARVVVEDFFDADFQVVVVEFEGKMGRWNLVAVLGSVNR